MIVASARVRDYKSVTDSGEVRFDESVTCLVGKNESGKTAFLEPVYRLNAVPTGHSESFVPLRDFPRGRWARERENVGGLRPVEVTFQLEEEDQRALEENFGKGVLKRKKLTRWRKYDNEFVSHIAEADVDEKAVMRHRLGQASLSRKLAEGCSTFAELTERLRDIDAPSAGEEELLAEIKDFDLAAQVRGFIRRRYPRFLYFDEYSVLPGRVSITRLQQQPDDLDSGERTALALLKLAGVHTADFAEEDYEARKAALEAASNELTREVFEYWSQNRDLRVELDLDFKAPPGPHGEEPPFLEIRINNLRHGVTLNVGERSRGFLWFFSFLAAFSEYRGRDDSLVLLLDEPGLGLHASAQSDLLRYIEERLAPSHQVVYTTHSPFMVDPTRLDRVRLVEDVDGEGTKISEDVLSTSRETVFPLQAALGYELAQTLFVGADNLVVEGPADYLYLIVLSGHLKALGRTGLDDRWTIVPVGGLDKIPTFVALLGAQLNVAVIMDGSAGGSQKLNSLIERGVVAAKSILALNTITGGPEADIEDLFDEEFYLRLLKGSGTATVTKTKLPPGNRIVKRIEAALDRPYDHHRPARHLLEKQADLVPTDEATLDRFEKLFTQTNKRLS